MSGESEGCAECGRGFLEGHERGCPAFGRVSPRFQGGQPVAGYTFTWEQTFAVPLPRVKEAGDAEGD